MEYCGEQLNQDEERFQKNMLADQATFEDRMDTLQVRVTVGMGGGVSEGWVWGGASEGWVWG